MPLPQDPIMLYSAVNMLLRDRYSSLDALCEGEDICREALCEKLAAAGFAFDPAAGQFR